MLQLFLENQQGELGQEKFQKESRVMNYLTVKEMVMATLHIKFRNNKNIKTK